MKQEYIPAKNSKKEEINFFAFFDLAVKISFVRVGSGGSWLFFPAPRA
jgi:hypothetical protein